MSCTDSSTTSSDSSDPGSPYSPGSVDEARRPPNDQHIIQSSTVSSSCKTDVPMLVRGVGGPVVPAASATGNINSKLLMHPWTNWTSGGSGGCVVGMGPGVDVLPKLVATTSVPKGLTITKSASKSIAQGKKGKNASPLVSSAGVGQVATVNFPVSSSTNGALVNGSPLAAATGPKPQTKITGFFKSQMKMSQQVPQVGFCPLDIFLE